jgi:hypothetical protein
MSYCLENSERARERVRERGERERQRQKESERGIHKKYMCMYFPEGFLPSLLTTVKVIYVYALLILSGKIGAFFLFTLLLVVY